MRVTRSRPDPAPNPSERPSRESYANRSREFSPYHPFHPCIRGWRPTSIPINTYTRWYRVSNGRFFLFLFFFFPPVLIHYSLDFHQDFFFFLPPLRWIEIIDLRTFKVSWVNFIRIKFNLLFETMRREKWSSVLIIYPHSTLFTCTRFVPKFQETFSQVKITHAMNHFTSLSNPDDHRRGGGSGTWARVKSF